MNNLENARRTTRRGREANCAEREREALLGTGMNIRVKRVSRRTLQWVGGKQGFSRVHRRNTWVGGKRRDAGKEKTEEREDRENKQSMVTVSCTHTHTTQQTHTHTRPEFIHAYCSLKLVQRKTVKKILPKSEPQTEREKQVTFLDTTRISVLAYI